MGVPPNDGKMEGWLFIIRSHRFGLQFSRRRYFILQENYLRCYKTKPISQEEVTSCFVCFCCVSSFEILINSQCKRMQADRCLFGIDFFLFSSSCLFYWYKWELDRVEKRFECALDFLKQNLFLYFEGVCVCGGVDVCLIMILICTPVWFLDFYNLNGNWKWILPYLKFLSTDVDSWFCFRHQIFQNLSTLLLIPGYDFIFPRRTKGEEVKVFQVVYNIKSMVGWKAYLSENVMPCWEWKKGTFFIFDLSH